VKSFWNIEALILVIVSLVSSPSFAHSFDCSKASAPLDFAICSGPALEESNDKLAEQWSTLLGRLNQADRKALVRDQSLWMKTLTKRCRINTHKVRSGEIGETAQACVLSGLDARTEELKNWRSTGAVACEDNNVRLSKQEITRLQSALSGAGDKLADLVGDDGAVNFVCRDNRPGFNSLLWRPPTICFACGEVLWLGSIDGKEAIVRTASEGGNNDDNGANIVFDRSGTPFVMIEEDRMGHGEIATTYLLISMGDGSSTPLFGIDNSMTGCAPDDDGSIAESDDHLEMAKVSKSDGLTDIVFHLSSKDCRTGKTSSEIVRYVPTQQGFAKK